MRLSGSIDKRQQSRITRDPSMNMWLPIYPSPTCRHSSNDDGLVDICRLSGIESNI